MSKPLDAITLVIPVHNTVDRLDRIVPAWHAVLDKSGRKFEILIVDDGSTDCTGEAVAKLPTRLHNVQVLKHDVPRGFGACLRTALAETKHPLFFYTALDYPYTPADLRQLLDRVELRDEILNKQPDLISGCRTGLPTPGFVKGIGSAWRFFWRVFAGMPLADPAPWHGWAAFWYATRTRWFYAVPLADVNSCFKLYRTEFLKRFPIQSDGDFVHTELVAKATFLTSIMDEVPLTPKPDPIPGLGSVTADSRQVFRSPEFTFPQSNPPEPPSPVVNAKGQPSPAVVVANPPAPEQSRNNVAVPGAVPEPAKNVPNPVPEVIKQVEPEPPATSPAPEQPRTDAVKSSVPEPIKYTPTPVIDPVEPRKPEPPASEPTPAT